MERVSLVQLNNALTTTGEPSQRRLPDAELTDLGLLMDQMQTRYPSQDQEGSIEGYLADFEQLALKYSLRSVRDALAELRIKPGQSFFPRPDEVAEEIESQRVRRTQDAARSEGDKWLASWDRHVREVKAERAQ